ncbi:MAG: DNA translocase FtsK [Bdellovibrionales bacterium]|nr:DNA translocase FtsK [Bdellovibrionales bacterium]
MFFGKKQSVPQKSMPRSITVAGTRPLPNPLVGEIQRLICFAFALTLILSLLSYSPSDPSWTTWNSKNHFQNWLGRSGSIVSDVLYQLFGLAAFMIAAIFVVFASRKPRAQSEAQSTNYFLAPTFFLVAVSALLQSLVPHRWTPWNLPNSGGMSGQVIHQFLTWASGTLGAFLISLFATVSLAMWLFKWNFVSAISHGIKVGSFKLREKRALYFKAWKEKFWTQLLILKNTFKQKKLLPIGIESTQAISTTETSNARPELLHLQIAKPAYQLPLPLPNPNQLLSVENCPPISTERSADDAEMIKVLNPELGKEKTISQMGRAQKKINMNFQLPQLSTLSGKANSKTKTVDKNWYLEKAKILVEKLKDFGVDGEVVHISPGPVITVYEFKPASGVKIKEISNLSDDLTLALSVLSVRIVAPIPGKPVVGIEIPSPHRETVFFKDLVQETPFFKSEIRIPVALGRLASGEPVTADLAAMPHLLVAGSTGTGKSVFINTLIFSLLYRFSPQQLKLILVDPKMVELSLYEGIPHLLLPVVVDSKKAALALRWAVEEMERRYSLMHQSGVRHVDSYNEKLTEVHGGPTEEQPFLPYIVIVIDEYADLMAVVPKDVELSIARLAQKARASGIHLVIATQRPSTDVVTGTIKANFPSRISFRVASSVDSKTILDRTGADRLLGSGDMLFHSAGFTSLKRMQGAFISDSDIERVVEHLKAQGGPEYDERVLQSLENAELGENAGSYSGEGTAEEARLFDEAVRLVTEKGEASISLVQRHLRIGYNRAATLIEQLEKEGIVGPSTGASKRRTVLVGQI